MERQLHRSWRERGEELLITSCSTKNQSEGKDMELIWNGQWNNKEAWLICPNSYIMLCNLFRWLCSVSLEFVIVVALSWDSQQHAEQKRCVKSGLNLDWEVCCGYTHSNVCTHSHKDVGTHPSGLKACSFLHTPLRHSHTYMTSGTWSSRDDERRKERSKNVI